MDELRVLLMAAVELDVNATYAQHHALNEISLWKKAASNWWLVIFIFIEQCLN